MSITPQAYAQVRAEIVELFGWDADGLSPDQSLRVDCAVALRIGLDDQHARIMRGEPVDMPKMLTVSEALSRLLPPAVLATPPAEQHDDHEATIAPLRKLYRYLHETVAKLEAENSQLRAALSGAPALPVHAPNLGHDPINPPTSAIVPPNELGRDCHAGIRPGLDDPPKPANVVIEGKAAPASRPQSWDDSPGGKAWRSWVDSGSAHYDRWANRNE
jgi:hypothetical protein